MNSSSNSDHPTDYVRAVIAAYRRLAGGSVRPRKEDHRLATELHRRGVPLDVVEAALLLATTRRLARPPQATALSPIRSLHYFLPVVEEVLRDPPSPSYLDYLRDAATRPHDHQVDRSHRRTGAVQKTTLFGDR